MAGWDELLNIAAEAGTACWMVGAVSASVPPATVAGMCALGGEVVTTTGLFASEATIVSAAVAGSSVLMSLSAEPSAAGGEAGAGAAAAEGIASALNWAFVLAGMGSAAV